MIKGVPIFKMHEGIPPTTPAPANGIVSIFLTFSSWERSYYNV